MVIDFGITLTIITIILFCVYFYIAEKQIKNLRKLGLINQALRAETMIISSRLSIEYLEKVDDCRKVLDAYSNVQLPSEVDQVEIEKAFKRLQKSNDKDFVGVQMLDVFRTKMKFWIEELSLLINEIEECKFQEDYARVSTFYQKKSKKSV